MTMIAVGDIHHQVHVVLDQHDRHAAIAQRRGCGRAGSVDFRCVQARGRLIDQQKLRLGRKRARELEHALLAIGQRAGKHVQRRSTCRRNQAAAAPRSRQRR